MNRHHAQLTNLVRRLRPSPESLAAAAAVQDPNLLLQYRAARVYEERRPRRPFRPVIRGDRGGALLLVAAVVLALLWSNSPWQATYAAVWHAPIALTIGPWTLGADLRTWIDEALMTLFFLVVGLGAMTIAGADRLRPFLLTLLVVDDVIALLVISFVYPGPLHATALVVAALLLATLLTIRAIAGRQFRERGDSTAVLTPLSVLIGVALWLALFESGIDPVISGLLIGLLTNAYEPRPRGPAAISPNDRMLATAATSPVTWGIVLAFVVGKPLPAAAPASASATCAAPRSRRA